MDVDAAENQKKNYSPLIPKHRQWPVVKLSKNREYFINEVIEQAKKRVHEKARNKKGLIEVLETTLYRERLRISQNAWSIDPRDEKVFWEKIKQQLVKITNQREASNTADIDNLLNRIIARYAREMAGSFKFSRYKFARNLATFGFSRLLNASRVKGWRSFYSNAYTLQDKINIVGAGDQIRSLAQKGTIVMVPTHFSNLDSILIGWVIHELGLPPFIYGAGLNLFNIHVISYFMNSLGAYKIDRRKKNLPYLETLKAYSRNALRHGCHSLFFPGGGRSRSGQIEDHLKLGLLGTAMEAQRENFQFPDDTTPQKIFIVPVVINYHFVLEAPMLINDFLSRKGQEKYYTEKDEYSDSYKIVKFLFKFFTKGSDISVNIGKAMDVMGNYVDNEGYSRDQQGRKINVRDYFLSYGKITTDVQREEEYTRMLGRAVTTAYYKNNRVFSSHLVAFAGFELLRKQFTNLDLFDFLRLPEEELEIPFETFKTAISNLRDRIYLLHHHQKINYAPHIKGDIEAVIDHGLANVGMYHIKRPLKKTKQGVITTEDLNTLYYYHNRLTGYGLENYL